MFIWFPAFGIPHHASRVFLSLTERFRAIFCGSLSAAVVGSPATQRHGTFSECAACRGLSGMRGCDARPSPSREVEERCTSWWALTVGSQGWSIWGGPRVLPPRCVLLPGKESLILFMVHACFSRALVWFSSEALRDSALIRQDHKHHFCLEILVASPPLQCKAQTSEHGLQVSWL